MKNYLYKGGYHTVYRNFTVTALIVAAGKGIRMGGSLKKPYINIGGKPLLARTLDVFQHCDTVDDIAVTVAGEDISRCRSGIVEMFSLTKVTDVLAGGGTRQQSVAAGLEVVAGDIVVIHDGARPFIDCGLIEQCVEKLILQNIEGIACAVVPKDTIKSVDIKGVVQKTLDRESLRAVQTPQCFIAESVKRAHKNAAREGIAATDDLALLEHYGRRVGLHTGRYSNIKITTPEDLLIAEALIRRGDEA